MDFVNFTRARRSATSRGVVTKQTVIGNQIIRAETFAGDGSETEFRMGLPGQQTVVSIAVGDGRASPVASLLWDSLTLDVSALSSVAGQNRDVRDLSLNNSTATVPRRISLQVTESPGVSADLSAAWETSTVALTISAPGLTDLVLPGPNSPGVSMSDTDAPYTWDLTASMWDDAGGDAWIADYLALPASEQAQAVATLNDGIAVSDTLDVSDVIDLTVGGTATQLGESSDAWHFSRARQALIAGTAPGNGTQVVVRYRANNVSVSDGARSLPIARVERSTGLLDLEEGDRLADALRTRNSRNEESLDLELSFTRRLHVEPGQTFAMTDELATRLGVENPQSNDRWLVEGLTIRSAGDHLIYTATVRRHRLRQNMDFWRRLARR